MGYYTRYDVSVMDQYADDGLATDLSALDLDQLVTQSLKSGYSPFSDSCKWYDHKAEMEAFSKKYPKATFVLYGEGEEFPDVWKEYYRAGKSYKSPAKITWDAFDADKLA